MNGTEEESGYLNVTAPEVAHRLGHTASSINHEDHHHGFAQFLLITVLVASQVGLYVPHAR